MPSKLDLFGGSRQGVSWAPDHQGNTAQTRAFEEYLEEVSKSIARHEEGRDYFPGHGQILKGVRPPKGYDDQRQANLGALEELKKALPADQLAAMSAQLEGMHEALAKDWDASFPESGTL